MSKHVDHVYEMQKNFTGEQKAFYGDYFKRYNSYLTLLSGPQNVKKIQDPKLYNIFECILKDVSPKAEYVHEPLRYKLYHILFRYCPTSVRDYVITKYYMAMPEYHSVNPEFAI